MAAKSSIRDTARVLDLSLSDADRVAKLVPDFTSLSKIFSLDDKSLNKEFKGDQYTNAMKLKKLSTETDLIAQTIQHAKLLEGSVRNVGTHACGVIITPRPLIDLIPMTNSKDM